MNKNQVLAEIDKAFGEISRPEQFVRNPGHCCECAEHEETLRGVTPETISLNEVSSPAWDPVTFASDRAFQYFMPGLARLALGKGEDYYLDQFLFHLDSGRIDELSSVQKKAVLNLLWFISEMMPGKIESKVWGDIELGRVIDKLEGKWV